GRKTGHHQRDPHRQRRQQGQTPFPVHYILLFNGPICSCLHVVVQVAYLPSCKPLGLCQTVKRAPTHFGDSLGKKDSPILLFPLTNMGENGVSAGHLFAPKPLDNRAATVQTHFYLLWWQGACIPQLRCQCLPSW